MLATVHLHQLALFSHLLTLYHTPDETSMGETLIQAMGKEGLTRTQKHQLHLAGISSVAVFASLA
jgi:hypothetical protein